MKDNLQFLLIICLFAYVLFLQQCQGDKTQEGRSGHVIDTIVRIDTQRVEPVVIRLPSQQWPPPTIIYIDSSKKVVERAYVDTNTHTAAKLYKDSLEDENLTLYYNSIIEGELLQNSFDYKLKIPKQITKTIEVSKPYPMPVSRLLFNTGIGTDTHSFNSLTVGLQFVSRKGWALGYDYDAFQQSHQITLGVQLFQFDYKLKN
jgi:hypothetical protein